MSLQNNAFGLSACKVVLIAKIRNCLSQEAEEKAMKASKNCQSGMSQMKEKMALNHAMRIQKLRKTNVIPVGA